MTAPPTKRKYVQLDEAEWAEVEALWSFGSATLPEIAHRFGISERGLQAHFVKRGIAKGQSAKALAAQVVARVQREQADAADTLTARALAIRETTFDHADKIERMIVERLDAAAADPAQTYAAAAAVKMLGNAAAALERLHTLKRSALGITEDDMNSDEVPSLVIRNLTDANIIEMRRRQAEEDELDGDIPDDGLDDVSSEIEEIVFELDDA